jgi:hypothetical protein
MRQVMLQCGNSNATTEVAQEGSLQIASMLEVISSWPTCRMLMGTFNQTETADATWHCAYPASCLLLLSAIPGAAY